MNIPNNGKSSLDHTSESAPINKIGYLKCLRGMDFGRNTGAVQVLVAIFTYTDERGRNAHPGVERLAADCCMGVSTVRAHLKLLEERRLIKLVSRGHRRGDGQNMASVYDLHLPSTAEPPAVETPPTTPLSTAGPPAVETAEPPSTAEPPAVENGSLPPTSGFSTADLAVSTAEPPAPIKSFTSTPKTSNPVGGACAREVALTDETPTPAIYLPSSEEQELLGITPPSRFCEEHPGGTAKKCWGCGRARKYRDETWPYSPEGIQYRSFQAGIDRTVRRSGKQVGQQLEYDRMRARGGLPPKSLPEMISEMLAPNVGNGHELSPADQKAANWMALGRRQSQRLPTIDVELVEADPVRDPRLRSHGQLSACAARVRDGDVPPRRNGRSREQQTAGLQKLIESDPGRWGAPNDGPCGTRTNGKEAHA